MHRRRLLIWYFCWMCQDPWILMISCRFCRRLSDFWRSKQLFNAHRALRNAFQRIAFPDQPPQITVGGRVYIRRNGEATDAPDDSGSTGEAAGESGNPDVAAVSLIRSSEDPHSHSRGICQSASSHQTAPPSTDSYDHSQNIMMSCRFCRRLSDFWRSS